YCIVYTKYLILLKNLTGVLTCSILIYHGRYDPRKQLDAITHFYVLDSLLHLDFAQAGAVLKYLILPSIALGTIPMAIIARMTRSSMLEVMNSDYIRTIRAKGGGQFIVI